jgi:hypothetical protein
MVGSGRYRAGILLILVFVALLASSVAGLADDEVTILPSPTPVASADLSGRTPSDVVPLPVNSDDIKVELYTEPSETTVFEGDEFYLVFRIIYHGSDSYWHVKSIDGPSLQGAVQLSHSVSSSVRQSAGVVVCEEIHKVRLKASGTEVAKVGSVAVVLLGEGGAIRHLQSNPFDVKLEPVFLGGYVTLPVSWILLFFVVFFIAALMIVVFRMRNKRLLMEQESADCSENLSKEARAAILLENIDQMKSSSLDDAKTFYKKSLEIIQSGLSLNGVSFDGQDFSSCFGNVPNMPVSLDRGLSKIVSDEKLVRFAGLKPSIEERGQVCSRLKEFITLNIEQGL